MAAQTTPPAPDADDEDAPPPAPRWDAYQARVYCPYPPGGAYTLAIRSPRKDSR